jgi:long-chain acyl-CoA synthetase
MVISGGVNIYPKEIETELYELPGVFDCAVFGIPDEEFGEALAAVIQRVKGAQLDETQVREFLRGRIAKYKLPKVIEFRDALPREDSGKLFKTQTARRILEGRRPTDLIISMQREATGTP